MRGKGFIKNKTIVWGRITPAYAGKREFFTTVLRSSRDHPRLCGEKFSVTPIFPETVGSPPPMRGKGESDGGNIGLSRITPAYAGKSVDTLNELRDS